MAEEVRILRVLLVVSILAMVLLASPAAARLYGDATLAGHMGGGFTLPLAAAADRLQTGWNFTMGGTYWPGPKPLGVMLELSFNQLSVSQAVLDALGVPGGHVSIIPLNINAVLSPRRSGRLGYYLVGGGGPYVLTAKATAQTYGGGGYCDSWWWGWCYPVIPPEITLAEVTRARPGLDGGLGITFDTGNESEVYIEARYHYVFLKDGQSVQFMPILAGLRF